MVPTARGRKHDTSTPMEIGMEDVEHASQEGDQRIVDFALKVAHMKEKLMAERRWTCGKTGRHIAAWCRKVGTRICTPWTKMTVRTPKNRLNMKRICRHGAYW